VYGYYVLPILWGDSLVGRLDLKADRQNRTLLVQGSFAEPGAPTGAMAPDVVRELHLMAAWLGLPRVHIADRGDLAAALQRAALGTIASDG
jgi:uncharacterized protein YcaQ